MLSGLLVGAGSFQIEQYGGRTSIRLLGPPKQNVLYHQVKVSNLKLFETVLVWDHWVLRGLPGTAKSLSRGGHEVMNNHRVLRGLPGTAKSLYCQSHGGARGDEQSPFLWPRVGVVFTFSPVVSLLLHALGLLVLIAAQSLLMFIAKQLHHLM